MTTDAKTDASAALTALYQSLILAHSAKPRSYGPLADATVQASIDNPLCGDTITLYLRLSADHPAQPRLITQAGFSGDGCAIARASASMLTSLVEGKSPAEARALAHLLQRFVNSKPGAKTATAPDPESIEDFRALGDLVALKGLRSVPSRLRCGTLPWEALLAALS